MATEANLNRNITSPQDISTVYTGSSTGTKYVKVYKVKQIHMPQYYTRAPRTGAGNPNFF